MHSGSFLELFWAFGTTFEQYFTLIARKVVFSTTQFLPKTVGRLQLKGGLILQETLRGGHGRVSFTVQDASGEFS